MHRPKPCPFCQEPLVVDEDKFDRKYKIRCANIKCSVKPETNWYTDIYTALRYWNREIDI